MAFVLTTKVHYALQTYEPIIRHMLTNSNLTTLGISVGKRPMSQAEHNAMDGIFDVNLENPFNSNWRNGSNSILNLKPFQFGRLWKSVRKTNRTYAAFLKLHKPDVLIVQIDRESPATNLIESAQRLGIPCLLLQGAMSGKNLSYRSKYSVSNRVAKWLIGYSSGHHLEGQGGCDRIGAWGKSGANYYEHAGLQSSHVAQVGSPRLDTYMTELANSDTTSTCEILGIEPNTNFTLLATSPLDSIAEPGENISAIRTIIETAIEVSKQNPNFQLVVKPHPRELPSFEKYGIAELCRSSTAVTLARDISIAEALAASDRVIVFYSTVALEAALAGKPCIAFNPFNWNFGEEYTDIKLIDELTSTDQLRDFFTSSKEVLTVGDPSYFITDVGKSAKSVSSLIHHMAGYKM
ncbi:hypothetical protein GKO46_04950 [SAR202 cluster bacterium JH702]|uniref:Capsule polysaccharide biosynthesis protein n=1 Tax=Candidatus Lucifugimonas marina TaxID=3038979 RepID=A0ABD4XPD2_9CHLR|nr:hypothetical protein [SAR202 cluster bacterium JH702]